MGRLTLFDDNGDSSDEELSKIEIDKEYVKRFNHNKERDALREYEELKKKGLIDSSDSDSGDYSSGEEELIIPSKKAEVQFYDALLKIKNRDPILREKDAKLFNSDTEEDSDGDEEGDEASKKKKKKKKKGKKEKPLRLKDVNAMHLIEDGPEFDDEEEESEDDDGARYRVKSYFEEEEEKRQKLLKSLEEGEDDDGDGDLLRLKSSAKDEEEEDDDPVVEKVDEFFGEDEKLDDNDMFLKDFFRNRRWLDEGKSEGRGDVDVDLSEDEVIVEKQEDYERDFNFRHEENPGDRVMGHSRKVEGSVRKKDNARKSQRERKEDREEQAMFERKEELKRLKNLKKKEINDKLKKIREIAGIGEDKGVFIDKDDLDGDFDPKAHDRKMNEAFGKGYYEADDADPKFGSDEEDDEEHEKPDFDKEDELLGLSKGWDELENPGEGFKSVRERILKDRAVNSDEDGGDEREKGSKRKRKRKQSEVEKAVMEELMDEYYKLDYEDTIGDLKTRFKYKPVKAKKFGLSAEEILALDDKELNQYVSLKKIAPYREKEWEVPRIKTIQIKKNLKGSTSRPVDEDRKGKNHKAKEEEVNGVESEKSQPIEANGEKETVSRKRKRKQNQAEYKLPMNRIRAYGKIPSKSKTKKQK